MVNKFFNSFLKNEQLKSFWFYSSSKTLLDNHSARTNLQFSNFPYARFYQLVCFTAKRRNLYHKRIPKAVKMKWFPRENFLQVAGGLE